MLEELENVTLSDNEVSHELFDAYLLGNKTLPQAGDAIAICVGSELLNQGFHIDWSRFTNSELSKSQVETISKQLTSEHKAEGVHFVAGEQKESGEAKVGEKRLTGLWTDAKGSVMNLVGLYIAHKKDRDFSDDPEKYCQVPISLHNLSKQAHFILLPQSLNRDSLL